MTKEQLLNENAQGPLKGVLILDCSQYLTGPYATTMPSDMGATVIKVEPITGDQSREMGEEYFRIYNHGKKGIAVNLTKDEGQEIIYRMAKVSDVMLQNYRPGKAEKMKIDYATISKINPAIVYCSLSAFGNTPGYAQRRGMDPIGQGMGGVMSLTGEPDGPPLLAGIPVADVGTAFLAYSAIVSGLYRKAISGVGQEISLTMIDVLVFFLSTRFALWLRTKEIPKRFGSAHPAIVPYQAFPTRDGWITVGTPTQKQWIELCQVLGVPDMAKDSRFENNAKRLQNRKVLTDMLNDIFRRKSSEEWLEILEMNDVLCGPIWNVKEVIGSDLVRDHGFVQEVEHPIEGRYPVLATPFKFSATPGKIQFPSNLLGEYTAEVLKILGYSEGTIRDLENKKIIHTGNKKNKLD
jgi:succinate--hydroxymethylglutarate CoA-transferase